MGIKWRDIDLENAPMAMVCHVGQTKESLTFKISKTRTSRRTIAFPAITVKALRRRRGHLFGVQRRGAGRCTRGRTECPAHCVLRFPGNRARPWFSADRVDAAGGCFDEFKGLPGINGDSVTIDVGRKYHEGLEAFCDEVLADYEGRQDLNADRFLDDTRKLLDGIQRSDYGR